MERLPDFIIGGAMKSATTTLHYLLMSIDQVFIPVEELFFFDLDDFEQHRNFFVPFGSKWIVPDYERDFDSNLLWYQSNFRDASDNQIAGEDTTTYLSSRKAPPRIAKLLPNVKLIFLLRDPVERAHSHYWHLVRTGAMTHSFENSIRRDPSTILQRGHYKEQLQKYYEFFEKDRIRVLLFEHLIEAADQTLSETCAFLGIERQSNSIPLKSNYNRTNPPRCVRMQLVLNRILSIRDSRRYLNHGARNTGKKNKKREAKFIAETKQMIKRALFDDTKSLPPMSKSTKEFLSKYYRMENRGLEDLINQDLHSIWRSTYGN